MKTITISLAAAGVAGAVMPKPVTIPTKNIPSFGVLEDEEVVTEDRPELRSSDEYFHADRGITKTEKLSLADQTLMDGYLLEAKAVEDIDVAHALVLALMAEYDRLTGDFKNQVPWEYRWDHGDMA